MNLIVDSWPDTSPYVKFVSSPERNETGGGLRSQLKGKGRASDAEGGTDLISINALAETMEIVLGLARETNAFISQAPVDAIALRVREVLLLRLNNLPSEAPGNRRNRREAAEGGDDWLGNGELAASDRVDCALAGLLERLGNNVKDPERSDRGQGRSTQLISDIVAEYGEKLVHCLIDRDVDLGLKVSSCSLRKISETSGGLTFSCSTTARVNVRPFASLNSSDTSSFHCCRLLRYFPANRTSSNSN